MRLWSVHPRHLDTAGLVALWREGLLAKAVLSGKTRGYRHHPQLDRFRGARNPVGAINAYLKAVEAEARSRGYQFDRRKLKGVTSRARLTVTRGQLRYEWAHLLAKLRRRSPKAFAAASDCRPKAHPMFRVRAGAIADWEKRSR